MGLRAAAMAGQGVTPVHPCRSTQGSGSLTPVTKAAVRDHRGGPRGDPGRAVRRDPRVPPAGLRWGAADLVTGTVQTSPAARWPVPPAAPRPGSLPGLRRDSCPAPRLVPTAARIQHRGRRGGTAGRRPGRRLRPRSGSCCSTHRHRAGLATGGRPLRTGPGRPGCQRRWSSR